METQTKPTFIIPATFEKLLGCQLWLYINGQLLFFDNETQQYVITQISNDHNYTAADYMLLPEGAPFQLINSKLIYMAAPLLKHQIISMKLSIELGSYIYSNKLGEIVAAPADVKFDDDNVFQPDLLFVSIARSSILQRIVFGAPDFIVEITSKSTEQRDRNEKMKIYGKYNVIEYWLVQPETEIVEVFHNQNHQMQLAQVATRTDTIHSKAIAGFTLSLEKIFE